MIRCRLLFCATFLCCLNAVEAFAQNTPTDVYQHALRIEAEINLIRLEMGVVDPIRPDIAISGAQPREVYFQVLTLFDKANRLLFEQVRERADTPDRNTVDLTSDGVIQMVDAALELILRVKLSLGINESATAVLRNDEATATEVYVLVVRLNRMLNDLLRQQFEPAEVYQQVTYGVGLAASILASINVENRLGVEPAMIRRKTPLDVYRSLIAIYSVIHEALKLSGEQCLAIEGIESQITEVGPSDVYDMASLIVSQLSFIHGLAHNTVAPKESYYPGDKLPSHVYQRAGRLKSQVVILHEYVSKNPTWLRSR